MVFPFAVVSDYIYTSKENIMWWLIFVFTGAVSYWLWVQKDDQKRVDDEVSRRKEVWQQEEDERARAREVEKRRKYVEMVQRRIDKSD